MSGDYRSKKEVAYLLVPSIGRKVFDLGGNLEKGACTAYAFSRCSHLLGGGDDSSYIQAYWKLDDSGLHGNLGRRPDFG